MAVIPSRLAELQPAAAAALAEAHDVLWREADPALLELCRRHLARLLGDDGGPAGPEASDPREAAWIDFVDQFVFSVGDVSDAQVEALLAHDPPDRVYALICGVYLLELTSRMRGAVAGVLGGDAGPA